VRLTVADHSPGPWEVFHGYLVRAVRGQVAIPLLVSRPSNRLASSCDQDALLAAEAEMQANLLLAAASPELLAACEAEERFAAAVEATARGEEVAVRDLAILADESARLRRIAIAKARGACAIVEAGPG
jgi:hypothetical protein